MKPATVVEVILSYISLGWAFVLFTTPSLFDQSLEWNVIESLVSYEWVVGIAALLCATVKIIGMTFRKWRLRWFGLIMSTFLWIIIASGFLVARGEINLTTGFIAYSGIAVMSLWTSKEVIISERTDKRSDRRTSKTIAKRVQ